MYNRVSRTEPQEASTKHVQEGGASQTKKGVESEAIFD